MYKIQFYSTIICRFQTLSYYYTRLKHTFYYYCVTDVHLIESRVCFSITLKYNYSLE